ncbi:MAG: hypothetical protein IGS48_08045 [Oscillatoriales cyanobacterium C42_A2020_001]|nr:hypothetical protein [Leptolyngbyaceae cyanobacterium C42_A2020_001]
MRSPLPFAFFLATISVTALATSIQAQVPPKGTFTATQAYPAERAIKGEKPGKVMLCVADRELFLHFNNLLG